MMNQDPNQPDNTHSLSERFDRGERTGPTDEETRVLRSYQRIQEQLGRIPLPEYDPADLAERMEREYRRQDPEPNRAWRWPRWTAAAALVLIFLAAGGMYYGLSTSASAVNELAFESLGGNRDFTASRLWRWRLDRGGFVTTPENQKTTLSLTDGSRIECSPRTRLRIDYGSRRFIDLQSGEILVHAASVPDSTLTVQTPHLNVDVVGTVFRVKIVE